MTSTTFLVLTSGLVESIRRDTNPETLQRRPGSVLLHSPCIPLNLYTTLIWLAGQVSTFSGTWDHTSARLAQATGLTGSPHLRKTGPAGPSLSCFKGQPAQHVGAWCWGRGPELLLLLPFNVSHSIYLPFTGSSLGDVCVCVCVCVCVHSFLQFVRWTEEHTVHKPPLLWNTQLLKHWYIFKYTESESAKYTTATWRGSLGVKTRAGGERREADDCRRQWGQTHR